MIFIDIELGIIVENIMRALFYFLNSLIYRLIINIYDIFIMLCNGRILESEVVNQLTVRIGTILGVLMMFMVVFGFIQMLLNPDTINDKEKGVGNIVKKILLVVVMLGISTYVFNLLTNIQVTVINSNAIANLLVPNEVNTDAFGSALSGSLFAAFYTSNVENSTEYCATEGFLEDLKMNISLDPPNFEHGKVCLYKTVPDPTTGSKIHVREFNWLLCTIVGAVIVYFIFGYCINVGVRIIQIAILQIISPMAIISYLSPKKDNMFSKWTKLYFNTYIDVFIRIAIINFVVFLIGIILDGWNNQDTVFWQSLGIDSNTPATLTFLIGAIMIMALLSFAKKAPDLIKELFPSSAGSIGFGFGLGNSGAAGLIGAALGAGLGAIGGFAGGKGLSRLTGLAGGAATGLFRGGKAGFDAKGLGNAISSSTSAQAKANLARAQRIASGKTFGEHIGDAVRGKLGIMSGYEQYNQELSMSNSIKDTLKGEDPVKHLNEIRQSYLNNLKPGESADGNVLREFDDAEKSILRQMYAHAYKNASGDEKITVNPIVVNGEKIMDGYEDKYTSNQGIHNQIHTNEKRAGKKLETYDTWKSDNNDIKKRIADKHKKIG